MPLFMFKCPRCEIVVEKLIKDIKKQEVLCEECGELCERQMSMCYNRVYLDSKALYNDKILPDINRINKDINSGKDDAFFDICGEK